MKVIVKKIDLASSSLGALSKNAYTINGVLHFVKGNDIGNMESFSEYLASKIFKFITDYDVISYDLYDASIFPKVATNGYEFVAACKKYKYKLRNFQKFLVSEEMSGRLSGIEDDFDTLIDHYGLDINQVIVTCIGDALIGNIDRHWNNFDVYYDEKYKLHFGPILDFGQSLLFCCPEEQLLYVKSATYDNANPFAKTHKEQIEYLKNTYGVRQLIKCAYSEFVDFISKELSNNMKYISKQRCDTLFYYLTERYKLYVEQFEE